MRTLWGFLLYQPEKKVVAWCVLVNLNIYLHITCPAVWLLHILISMLKWYSLNTLVLFFLPRFKVKAKELSISTSNIKITHFYITKIPNCTFFFGSTTILTLKYNVLQLLVALVILLPSLSNLHIHLYIRFLIIAWQVGTFMLSDIWLALQNPGTHNNIFMV